MQFMHSDAVSAHNDGNVVHVFGPARRVALFGENLPAGHEFGFVDACGQ